MIAFIFKSSLSLIILFGLYWLLLRNEKFFIFNRCFLILSVIFSLLLPFITIPVNIHIQAPETIITTFENNIPEINPAHNGISQEIQINQSFEQEQQSGIGISSILIILYISGVILFLLRFLKNIYHIFHRIKLSEKISFEGHRLVLTNDQTNPYCFFNYIFIYKDDYLNLRSNDHLLNHELVHVRQYHSVDIVFIELIKIFYWFNPVFLLYDKAIRINHEYLADHNVIRENCDIKSYAYKILSFIVGKSNIPLTSGSNHSFTKKRLLMMTKSKSKSIIYGFRITVTLCIILVFFFLLSFKQSNRELDSGGLIGLQSQTVKDIDGNVYPTIAIGTHIWMAENLKTTRYNDGTDIQLVTDDKQWQKYEPAYCWYNNDEAENKNKYGALYNWYAVNTNKLCPIGWHVTNKEELSSSITFIPRDTITGGNLKETGTFHWRIPNKGATNETGFTALPGGYRTFNGEFGYLGESGRWWASSEENNYVGFGWTLMYNNGQVAPFWPSKRVGISVRCIKDYSEGTSNSSIKSGEMIQQVVRGIVLAEDGKPLKGATIVSTGTKNTPSGVITGSDGGFALNNVQADDSLLIGCFGYKKQALKADFASEMIVKLIKYPDFPEIQDVNFRNSDFTPAKALIVIDGVIIDYKGELKVNPVEIKSIKVLKNKEATNKYGDKGNDGVVEIILYGNKTESAGGMPNNTASDTSRYIIQLSINRAANKGELIDIPVSNIQSVTVWTYHGENKNDKKELRYIGIMTRDFYKVKGRVVRENGKPLSGVKISVSENPVRVTSDKEGRFVIEDVGEDTLLEFSHSGYKPYYLSTSFGVAFTTELTIKLEKD